MQTRQLGHFNAVSEEGVRVGDIARKFAKAYGNKHETTVLNVDDLIHKHVSWAIGPTIKDYQSSNVFAQ